MLLASARRLSLKAVPVSKAIFAQSAGVAAQPRFVSAGVSRAVVINRKSLEKSRISKALVFTLEGHTDEVSCCAFSQDGLRLATGSEDTTVRVVDAMTGCLQIELSGHSQCVRGVSFSPCGKRLASVSADTTVLLWDLEHGKVLKRFQGHTQAVTSVAFSSNGRRLFTAGMDRSAILWDAGTGKKVLSLDDEEAILAARFSPCDSRVITGCWNKTHTIWDAVTGRRVKSAAGHKSAAIRSASRKSRSNSERALFPLVHNSFRKQQAHCSEPVKRAEN
ncbi:WD40-repeat-containing domain protein [Pelagophyceae sp. CCMP2097]|nr:WD40-repeat-containing domain protein [Pelagophyceae sp. CCMP2097]